MLTTLASAKLWAGITDSASDALINSLITAYSDWFRSAVNRSITIAANDIWRDGRDRTAMVMPDYPIVSVQMLMIDGRTIPAQSSFGSYGYRIAGDSIVLDGLTFGNGRANVNIQFTSGFATIPNDIVQAVNELVGLRYATQDKQGWSSKSLAGETVSIITKDMPDSVKAVVQQYMAVVPT